MRFVKPRLHRQCDWELAMSARAISNHSGLPSKAILARKWPRLRVNRLTGRWLDEASGSNGEDFQSLLAFLGKPTPRKPRARNAAASPSLKEGAPLAEGGRA
jgi:hypothetical protein